MPLHKYLKTGIAGLSMKEIHVSLYTVYDIMYPKRIISPPDPFFLRGQPTCDGFGFDRTAGVV